MLSTNPSVSIVMPLFNKERDVERAIHSILIQSFRDYEIIIVNDGSTDRGPDIVSKIIDSRLRMIHQANAGVSAARNRGIEEARADLIAFLDADDEWKPDFLETILSLRKKFSFCKVFATQYLLCSSDKQQKAAIIRGLPKGFLDGVLANYFEIASKSDPPLCSSAISVDKKAIMEIGGFPVGITSGEDLLTWARLAMRHEIAYYCKPKAHFWTPVSIQDRPGREPQFLDMVGRELKQILDAADQKRSPGIRTYVALWHRMRAVNFIQLGRKIDALRELMEAMKFAPSIRLLFLCLVTSLPRHFPAKVLMAIKRRM